MISSRKHNSSQSGYVLVFVAFFMIVLIALTGMVIDLGRFFIMARQLQNTADSASLAGVAALEKPNASNPYDVPKGYPAEAPRATGGWLQVKPRIRYVLNNSPIPGAQEITMSSAFSSGETGLPDTAPFDGTTIGSAGGDGSITAKVERGIVCYNGAGSSQHFRSLEGERSYYCIANAVQVTMSMFDIPTLFAGLMGFTKQSEIVRVGRSHQRRAPPYSCGDPDCSVYFESGSYDENQANGGPLKTSISCP